MGSKKKSKNPGLLGNNRKARFLYHVESELECGIALRGTEVKSIKSAQFSFTDAFVDAIDGELWLKHFHITPYNHGGVFNHESQRPRRLLAKKNEILKLERKVREKGLTLIPLKIYLKSGFVKVEIGLCRGKKLYDKRDTVKQRDLERDMDRAGRHRG